MTDGDKIRLAGKTYLFESREIPLNQLKYYVDNPRVYSCFDRSCEDPSQHDIEMALFKREKVKELKSAIESVGTLVSPLIVRDGDFTVLEGNQRLAAYRMLSKNDAHKWNYVPCRVLPEDISEDAIFALLGQFHLHGQQHWEPFELAGYLYRRIVSSGANPEAVAKELGVQPREVKEYYKIYEFMVKNDDLEPQHWSHYLEYLKSRKISKLRKECASLDKLIVEGIKRGTISDARKDIRETLSEVSDLPKTHRDDIIMGLESGKINVEQCKDFIGEKEKDILPALTKFKSLISDPKSEKTLVSLADEDQSNCLFELRMIRSKVDRIISKMEGDKRKGDDGTS